MSSETITKNDLTNILNEIVAIDGTDMTAQEIDDFVDSLNIASINAVDYIVDEGTDNGWIYKKYNNGTFDAWISFNLNVAVSTTTGSLYKSADQSLSLPSFTSSDTINNWAITGSVNGFESIWFLSFITSPPSVAYNLVRSTSRTSAERHICMTLHGKWKEITNE